MEIYKRNILREKERKHAFDQENKILTKKKRKENMILTKKKRKKTRFTKKKKEKKTRS